MSISEEENIPVNGADEGQASTNSSRKEGKENSSRSGDEKAPSSSSGSIKFTPTKFSAGNLAIPGLKRKEKNKNGEEKLDGKLTPKGESKKQKNSVKQNGKEGEEKSLSGKKEQEQLQQLIELKIITRPSSTSSQEQVSN